MLKPSEITPLTALKLAELKIPAGVINVLFGRGKTVGDPLTGHPKVRMVSLTGLYRHRRAHHQPYRIV